MIKRKQFERQGWIFQDESGNIQTYYHKYCINFNQALVLSYNIITGRIFIDNGESYDFNETYLDATVNNITEFKWAFKYLNIHFTLTPYIKSESIKEIPIVPLDPDAPNNTLFIINPENLLKLVPNPIDISLRNS